MSSTRQNALRNVAEAVLDQRLGQLDPGLRQQLDDYDGPLLVLVLQVSKL
jgi:hypothetical protein